ncbi:microcin C transport system substrate-binding protein [Bradyrhizobium japonicum]|uniref:extracellular solute-binding protein n=1 Tax=Bradyrhizobium TaxID=374 RepID=UPI00042570CA|nr:MULTISPECIES: extracellular solute-binding protein [Bradyrhizobium]MBR0877238.1 ABC transporter substrate-binding protein [Bradyrhizobium liaoningense]MBR0998006.1 ABC transporter substrate-binding protein [Bradyrhizobium liaoningense]MBR1063289.1 ABC transporter substrate-binding protein [Bradyrhizobium liaoningense]MCP1748069.1 microcin C transport system substrate-binding protein [Bradyrhizobium japonicum]MCP1783756.1 microcin C transport system substrate-binding protein [Bradyrhizobium 
MAITRRDLLLTGTAAVALPALGSVGGLPVIGTAKAQSAGEAPWRHALSLFGKVKYPADFKRFDYVNPEAPKGGVARQIAVGTFDNFNIVVSGVKGQVSGAVAFIYESLLTPALDEVSTEYGALAEAVSHPDDFSFVTYRLRPQAKWHDGKPVTTDDVIFSLDSFKKHHPMYSAYYSHVVKAEKVGEREVKFTFDAPGNRELPQIVGQLTVLPKHWWEGTDAQGRKRDVSATTLEMPLGSGPYRVKEFVAGRSIALERVKDYWGRDLAANVGRNNFDELRYEYFRDATVAIEAFKADQVDWRTENSAKNWATAYDFPAVTEKRVILEEFANRSSGVMQAFVPNLRRAKFSDPRVRRALNYAFDFEEMNKQIFYGQYKRISSYFDGIDELMATGLPQGKELEILETVRAEVPPEVFTTAYTNPVGGSPEAVRDNLREALRLFKEAGYEVRDRKLVDVKTGAQFTLELLNQDPSFERVTLFYKPSLERLGIAVSVRTVDPTQYENRTRDWDFEVVTNSWGESQSPGNEQREFWSSKTADIAGSRNIAGIKNPAIDKLIERLIYARDRDDLVAATKALDRVLLWNHYVVPQWTYTKVRTARWDRFGRPTELPRYGQSGFPFIWWYDPDKAARIAKKS